MQNLRAFNAMVQACYLGAAFVGGAQWAVLKAAMATGVKVTTGSDSENDDEDSGIDLERYHVPGSEALLKDESGSSDSDGNDSESISIAPINRDVTAEEEVIKDVQTYAAALLVDLKERFPERDSELVSLLSTCFHFPQFVLDKHGTLVDKSHGDLEMKKLITFFGSSTATGGITVAPLINAADARLEWSLFKFVLADYKKQGLDLDSAFKPLFDSEEYENMQIILCFFMCVCLTTVCCEVGFSLMAAIMTQLRNCLNIITLDALM
jgi:hypothetical protein